MTLSTPSLPAPSATAPAASPAGDAAAVEALVRRAGTSFFWAMKLLPAPRRAAMFAIYAFCREVDDVVDEPGTPAEKEAGLAWWRAEIDRAYEGASVPTGAIGRELALGIARFGLEREDFRAVIDGMAMDMGAPIQAPSLDELMLYCDRVAVAVGRLSVYAFGAPGPAGQRVAAAQGRALQLTNILRDLKEDAALGRLYLPRDLLAAEGIDARTPDAVLADAATARVCARLAVMAQAYFAEARAAMTACPPEAMRPARVMLEVYRRILDRLVARGWSDLDRAVGLPKPVKLWIALRHGLL